MKNWSFTSKILEKKNTPKKTTNKQKILYKLNTGSGPDQLLADRP